MAHIPVGSILLLVVVDLLVVELFSAMFGAVVARAAGRPVVLGLVIGLLLPVVGPLVWAMIAVARDPGLAKVRRSPSMAPMPMALVSAGLCLLAGVLLAVATPMRWGAVSGSFQTYALASDASPADTGVGLAATVGSGGVLLLLVPVLLFTTSRRRVSMVLGIVSGLWLLLTIDALIVFSALDGLSSLADGVSGGRAEVSADPEAALYLCLAGGLVAGVAAVVTLTARPGLSSAPPVVARVESPAPAVEPGGWSTSSWGSPASVSPSSGSGWGSPTSGPPTTPSPGDWAPRP